MYRINESEVNNNLEMKTRALLDAPLQQPSSLGRIRLLHGAASQPWPRPAWHLAERADEPSEHRTLRVAHSNPLSEEAQHLHSTDVGCRTKSNTFGILWSCNLLPYLMQINGFWDALTDVLVEIKSLLYSSGRLSLPRSCNRAFAFKPLSHCELPPSTGTKLLDKCCSLLLLYTKTIQDQNTYPTNFRLTVESNQLVTPPEGAEERPSFVSSAPWRWLRRKRAMNGSAAPAFPSPMSPATSSAKSSSTALPDRPARCWAFARLRSSFVRGTRTCNSACVFKTKHLIFGHFDPEQIFEGNENK